MIFTVAIDGPAAAGKGTIARAIAGRYGFAHLDSGLLYRAVARKALDGMSAEDAARGLDPSDLSEAGLRTAAISSEASRVAAIPEVRSALVHFQRAFARSEGGAVIDGRDIGTVICPEAEVKLFVTASPEVRAERRWKELTGSGADTTLDAVLADVHERDRRDAERATSPMIAAEDALQLDTSAMSIDEALAAAAAHVEARLPR
ncbi:(d)CMP kinase [Pseudoroseicyclus tamaricis]|uniref:Cytidylate kinase n=1 Tax=Pseudoroseicyclus tamaricis TaxID=2705421 RepID=A0A6B2K2G7_9RHOB|nr:d(CMP) kinase [Pseudoroseicyclus tamaricis]NDV01972.1 (d)CMP kinase [Pseudoroseicyclus tamaricis]